MVGSKRTNKRRWYRLYAQYIKFGAKKEKKNLQRRFRRNPMLEIASGCAYRKLGGDAKTEWIS